MNFSSLILAQMFLPTTFVRESLNANDFENILGGTRRGSEFYCSLDNTDRFVYFFILAQMLRRTTFVRDLHPFCAL
jgi:hypothetical protein